LAIAKPIALFRTFGFCAIRCFPNAVFSAFLVLEPVCDGIQAHILLLARPHVLQYRLVVVDLIIAQHNGI
jgi:threonine/homoserine efflux transporter RhtA